MKRVFLIGATRSGTTLLQSRLMMAGQFASLPETGYFNALFGLSIPRTFSDKGLTFTQQFKRHIRLRWGVAARTRRASNVLTKVAERAEIEMPTRPHTRLLVKSAVNDFVQLLDAIAKQSNVDAWLEKTPAHTYLIPEIEHYVPDALFIHIIRGGEDVVASNIDAARKYRGEAHNFQDNPELSVNRWNNAIREQIRHLGKDNHFFLSYDCLLQEGQSAVDRILGYFGIPKRDTEASPTLEPNSKIVVKRERWKSGIKAEITPPENKFRTVLDENERRYVSEHLISLEPFLTARGKNVFNRVG